MSITGESIGRLVALLQTDMAHNTRIHPSNAKQLPQNGQNDDNIKLRIKSYKN